MKIFTLLFVLGLSSGLWSQVSLRHANSLFNKYEYSGAAAMFAELSSTKPLSIEDYKKLGYCYFIVGDFKNCLPISDSILKLSDPKPFFYYMNGEANFGEGNYEIAKASYITYQGKDDEYNVDVKILSCDLVREEAVSEHLVNQLAPGNNSKANITGEKYLDGVIEFIEVGQDSSGTFVDIADINYAELVLARPFIRIGDEDRKIISLDETFRDVAISSFTLSEKTSEVWLTVARPLAIEQIDKVPHLYHGKFDPATLNITELERWNYSGYEDSSACAHATINESGDLIIFSKSGESTKGSDLYQSKLVNGNWSKPTSLTRFNTIEDEMYPQFMGDTLLSFSSDGRPGFGGLDIYTSSIINGNFEEVEHIASPVNGARDDFNFNYFSNNKKSARYTSNRLGGAGDDDMYYIRYEKEEIVIPTPPVPDSVEYHDFVRNYEAPIFYFKFDKFNLEDNPKKVAQLVTFLGNYPNSSILVEGNTDRRGRKQYNLNLSAQRAIALKEALIEKGVNKNQINTVGNANTVPLNGCGICTEAMHAENRYARIQLIAK